MIETVMTWPEVWMGANLGLYRHMASLKRGSADNHGLKSAGWSEHIIGAIGEMAVAKAFNVPYVPTEGTFSAPDLGQVQIRTRSRHNWDLPIRPTDKDDEAVFILVTGKAFEYRIHGWIVAGEGKKDKWWGDKGGRDKPAWWVPQSALNPITTLDEELLTTPNSLS